MSGSGIRCPETDTWIAMALSRRASIQPLEEREAGLRPGKPIKDKKQISFADHESRIMKHKGDFEYVYNVQISTARMHQD